MPGQKVNSHELPDLIPVRMLNEFTYCPRLFYLEWVQGEFEENVEVADGHYQHRRVDKESGKVPEQEEIQEKEELQVARSVLVSSEKNKLISRTDLLEIKKGEVSPVEYKRGYAPDIPEGAWDTEKIQLCAQGIILRDNGYTCNSGYIYYTGSRTRVNIEFSDELVQKTLNCREELLKVAQSGVIPEPLIEDPRCPRCSLVGICLPDEVNMLYENQAKSEVRRLVSARYDALPAYVQKQGAVVGKKSERLAINYKGKTLDEIKLIDISQLNVFGNVQVTTQALRELFARGITTCYFSYGGWFTGYAVNTAHKNVELRIRQFASYEDSDFIIKISRHIVAGKLKNSRTFLRRNHKIDAGPAVKELNRLIKKAKTASDIENLLGIEGAAARVYFSHLAGMLKTEDSTGIFKFKNRNRRPPTDPVNAMLSFAYALLVKEAFVVLLSTGFDPFLGFYHRPRYGRPALALDLMEEFRPLIADSVVISLINNQEIVSDDFVYRAGSVALNENGRKKTIAGFERRMETLITHPLFGYQISYRRVLEVQARLMGRFLLGEIDKYPAFLTR